MSLIFSKYQGFYHEYLIYDINKNKKIFHTDVIRSLYRGNLGLGSNGIMVGPYKINNKFHFKVYNPRGVQVENNKIERAIFFQYLKDTGYIQSTDIKLKDSYISEIITNLKEAGHMITISMGALSFDSEKVGMNTLTGEMINIPLYFDGREYWSTCVYTDRPHCVIPMQEVSSDKIRSIGKNSEHKNYFTKPMCFEIVKVLDKKNIQIEAYEQGVGYQSAFVEAAIASAGVVYKLGMVDSNITVHMPGGKLIVDINPDMGVELTSKVASIGSVYMLDEYVEDKLALTC